MKVLILEDEPIIAIDLEDLVTSGRAGTECVLAATVEAGLRHVRAGVDFAVLDIAIGDETNTSLPVATMLRERAIPFCFVSSVAAAVPQGFGNVPFLIKPFDPEDIVTLVRQSGAKPERDPDGRL